MRRRRLLAGLLVASALAGCVGDAGDWATFSTTEGIDLSVREALAGGGQQTSGFLVTVPSNVHTLEVLVTASLTDAPDPRLGDALVNVTVRLVDPNGTERARASLHASGSVLWREPRPMPGEWVVEVSARAEGRVAFVVQGLPP